MQRRDVLRGSAALGASALGASASGCAGGGSALRVEPPMPPDVSALAGEFAANMDVIARSTFVEGFVTSLSPRGIDPARREAIAAHEAVFRRSLRSLYLTQSFRDLPREAQFHPEMQALMQRHLDEVDSTVFEVTDLLERVEPKQREAARQMLKQRPDLALRISEAVDEHAARVGVAPRRRHELRAMMTQASFRLRNSAPGVLIDECVGKVRRATAQDGRTTDLALRLSAQAGSELFFAGTGAVSGGLANPAPAATTSSNAATAVVVPPASAAPSPKPGLGVVRTGAALLGIGAAVFGVSALLTSSVASGFVIGMTVGAILFAVGLLMLIVGALILVFS